LARSKKCRRLSDIPIFKGFKPFGVSLFSVEPVIIALEEYEAFKLADYTGLSHEEAAVKMDISRPTFTRIYESVRKKIALALAEGKSFIIEGGNVELDFDRYRCNDCDNIFRSETGIDIKEIACSKCGSINIKSLNECFTIGCGSCCKCK